MFLTVYAFSQRLQMKPADLYAWANQEKMPSHVGDVKRLRAFFAMPRGRRISRHAACRRYRMKHKVFVFPYFPLWRSQLVVGPVGAWWTMFVLVPSVHRLS